MARQQGVAQWSIPDELSRVDATVCVHDVGGTAANSLCTSACAVWNQSLESVFSSLLR
jgi:hypothetical protein